MRYLTQIVSANRAGRLAALPSVCSAHPDVLMASMMLARDLDRDLLVEATSNQVNQFGGYTGMTPKDFIAFVHEIATKAGFDPARVHFGGDHLGPQVWRSKDAETAMRHARDMMRAFVEAGFTKIHLDCSEGCAGEPPQVSDEVSAERAAELAAVCETHAPDAAQLSYIVGTEVPPPGGARADEVDHGITPTDPERARYTIKCHRDAFAAAGLAGVWPRIVGLVVQPGLEFGPTRIDRLDTTAPDNLSAVLQDEPHLSFEAHSTDYQFDDVFPDLARRHFAVLKVGPALTFAYRQAIYALDHISRHLDPARSGQDVMDCMERLMLAEPGNWAKHYAGEDEERRLLRHFGYADRIRYYWPHPDAQQAVAGLLAALDGPEAPRPLLEQYFSPEVIARAEVNAERSTPWARRLIHAQIQAALAPYFFGEA